MKNEKILFLGGPKNGEFVSIPEGYDDWSVLAENGGNSTVRYYRRILRLSQPEKSIEVFTLNGMDEQEAYRVAIEAYAKKGY